MSHGQLHDVVEGAAAAASGIGINMNAMHMDTSSVSHFENILNLNMTADYHYGVEYWNGYKNGSTPMKEMEGESGHFSVSCKCVIFDEVPSLRERPTAPLITRRA